MSDNVVFMRITNPAGKTTSRGFEVNRDGIVLNPVNHDPMFFAGREGDPIRVSEDAVEIVNESDQFALEQFLAGNCNSIRAGVDLFYAKQDEDKKAERDAENDFLRSKGYRWEKRSVYNSGPGEMVDRWFLFDPDGEIVVGYKDAGFDLLPFGSVKDILTELGYYGQEAIDAADAEKQAAAQRREMREAIFNHFAQYALETPDAIKFTTPPIEIDSHMPRRRFRIEDGALWIERHNTADGDDWSLNNCDYGIASKYPFDAEIADYLRALAVKSSEGGPSNE